MDKQLRRYMHNYRQTDKHKKPRWTNKYTDIYITILFSCLWTRFSSIQRNRQTNKQMDKPIVFTSGETEGLLGTGAQDGHSTSAQLLSSELFGHKKCFWIAALVSIVSWFQKQGCFISSCRFLEESKKCNTDAAVKEEYTPCMHEWFVSTGKSISCQCFKSNQIKSLYCSRA